MGKAAPVLLLQTQLGTAACLPSTRVFPAEGLIPHTSPCGKCGLADFLANTIWPSAAVVNWLSPSASSFASQSGMYKSPPQWSVNFVLMWLYLGASSSHFHFCLLSFSFGLFSLFFSDILVSKVREGTHRLTVITMVLLGSCFDAHKTGSWTSLWNIRSLGRRIVVPFIFFPIRTDSDKGFVFHNCPCWSSMSSLIRSPQ